MRRNIHSSAFAKRALVALLCVFALAVNVIGHSQVRGTRAGAPSQPAIIMASLAQQSPAAASSVTVCPYAVLVAALARSDGLAGPEGSASKLRHAVSSDEAFPYSRTSGTPFRPPRTA